MPSDGATQSRLGGLAGGLWVEEESGENAARSSAPPALARILDGFCETVLWAGGAPPRGVPGRPVPTLEGAPGPLRALGSVLAASELDRVLFASRAETELERLLALVAYPRQSFVAYRPVRGEAVAAVFCEREPVLDEVLKQLSAGRADLESLVPALDAPLIEGRSD